jgi:hypothetical protein
VEERRLALGRAKECGLDWGRVAVGTAEKTVDRAFEVCSFFSFRFLGNDGEGCMLT